MEEMIQEVLLLWTLKGCRLKKLWTLKERYKWTPGKHHLGPVGVSLDLFVPLFQDWQRLWGLDTRC